MMPTIEQYSEGYHLVRGLHPEPVDDDAPRIEDHLYGQIQDEVYESAQTPIMMRVGHEGPHLGVEPGASSAGTLEVPSEILENAIADESDPVLLTRPWHARQIYALHEMASQFLDDGADQGDVDEWGPPPGW